MFTVETGLNSNVKIYANLLMTTNESKTVVFRFKRTTNTLEVESKTKGKFSAKRERKSTK